MNVTTKAAGEIKVGDILCENGGMDWRVAAVEPVGKTSVNVSLTPDEAGFWASRPQACVKQLRRTSRVTVISAE